MKSHCEACPLRRRAEEKPKSLVGRFWWWHTTWCPGWKAYLKEMEAQKQEPAKEG